MASGTHIVNFATSDVIDSESERSQSAISDCYSNDEDYIEDNSRDKDTIESNLFLNYSKKLNFANGYSMEIDDNIHRSKSDVDVNDGISELESVKSKKAQVLKINNVESNSTELFKREPKPSERFVEKNNFSSSERDLKLKGESLNSILYKDKLNSRIEKYESSEHSENTISNSLFDFSKKNEDSYLNAKGDALKPENSRSIIKEKKRFFEKKNPIEQNYESDSRNDLEYGAQGDLIRNRRLSLVRSNRKVIPLKSISYCSSACENAKEQSTQTMVTKSTNSLQDNDGQASQNTLLPAHETRGFEPEEAANISVAATLDILKMHIKGILSQGASEGGAGFQITEPRLRHFRNNFLYHNTGKYPDSALNDLYSQIKLMYTLLDSKVNKRVKKDNITKHRRGYSENTHSKKIIKYDNLDPGMESSMAHGDSQAGSKRMSYLSNCSQVIDEEDLLSCRIFEINPYDDLIKSYQSQSDRRVKAVGNKMKCQILITGPICMFDSTSSCWNMRNKTAYRCSIRGASKELVEKCLKCLQDTFPQSCLNEKRVISKLENKTYV